MPNRAAIFAVTAALAAVTPSTVYAQKLGQVGTGVYETTDLPRCDMPLGVAALVEQPRLASRQRVALQAGTGVLPTARAAQTVTSAAPGK